MTRPLLCSAPSPSLTQISGMASACLAGAPASGGMSHHPPQISSTLVSASLAPLSTKNVRGQPTPTQDSFPSQPPSGISSLASASSSTTTPPRIKSPRSQPISTSLPTSYVDSGRTGSSLRTGDARRQVPPLRNSFPLQPSSRIMPASCLVGATFLTESPRRPNTPTRNSFPPQPLSQTSYLTGFLKEVRRRPSTPTRDALSPTPSQTSLVLASASCPLGNQLLTESPRRSSTPTRDSFPQQPLSRTSRLTGALRESPRRSSTPTRDSLSPQPSSQTSLALASASAPLGNPLLTESQRRSSTPTRDSFPLEPSPRTMLANASCPSRAISTLLSSASCPSRAGESPHRQSTPTRKSFGSQPPLARGSSSIGPTPTRNPFPSQPWTQLPPTSSSASCSMGTRQELLSVPCLSRAPLSMQSPRRQSSLIIGTPGIAPAVRYARSSSSSRSVSPEQPASLNSSSGALAQQISAQQFPTPSGNLDRCQNHSFTSSPLQIFPSATINRNSENALATSPSEELLLNRGRELVTALRQQMQNSKNADCPIPFDSLCDFDRSQSSGTSDTKSSMVKNHPAERTDTQLANWSKLAFSSKEDSLRIFRDVVHEAFVAVENSRIPWTPVQWNGEEAQSFGSRILSGFGVDLPQWPMTIWLSLYRGVLMAAGEIDQPPNEDIAGAFARCILEQVVAERKDPPQLAKCYSFGSLSGEFTTSAPGVAAPTGQVPMGECQNFNQYEPSTTLCRPESTFGRKGRIAWRGRLGESSASAEQSLEHENEATSPLSGVSAFPGYMPTVEEETRSECDVPTLWYSTESSPAILPECPSGCDEQTAKRAQRHDDLPEDVRKLSFHQVVSLLRDRLEQEQIQNHTDWQLLMDFLEHVPVSPGSSSCPGDTGSEIRWRPDDCGGVQPNAERCAQLPAEVVLACEAIGMADGPNVQNTQVDDSLLSSIPEDCVAIPDRDSEMSACAVNSFGLNITLPTEVHDTKLAVARATLAELGRNDSILTLPDSSEDDDDDVYISSDENSLNRAPGLQDGYLDISSELTFYQQRWLEMEEKQHRLINEVRLRDDEVSELREAMNLM